MWWRLLGVLVQEHLRHVLLCQFKILTRSTFVIWSLIIFHRIKKSWAASYRTNTRKKQNLNQHLAYSVILLAPEFSFISPNSTTVTFQLPTLCTLLLAKNPIMPQHCMGFSPPPLIIRSPIPLFLSNMGANEYKSNEDSFQITFPNENRMPAVAPYISRCALRDSRQDPWDAQTSVCVSASPPRAAAFGRGHLPSARQHQKALQFFTRKNRNNNHT